MLHVKIHSAFNILRNAWQLQKSGSVTTLGNYHVIYEQLTDSSSLVSRPDKRRD